MPAPGSLYGEGAQLLEGAATTQAQAGELEQKKTAAQLDVGKSASSELTGEREQISGQQATMALEKLKASEKMQGKVTTITPQIALGLAKNTGDKEWMSAIGQDMRTDVLLGMYTHGMTVAQQKKQPKITQIYDKSGKIRHAVVYTDEQGNQQEMLLDEGMTPEALNKGKNVGRGGKGGAGGSDEFKNKKEFIANYQKRRNELADPMRAKDLKSSNPQKYEQDQQFLQDYKDQYDKDIKEMSQGGSSGSEGSPAPSPGGGKAFDPNSIFDEVLSGK